MVPLNASTDEAILAAANWQIVVGIVALIVGVVSIILAGRSIRLAKEATGIAAATVREQRENREFPADKSYADAFAATMRRDKIEAQDFVSVAVEFRKLKYDKLTAACQEYIESVSEPNGLQLYFNGKRHELWEIANEADDPADPTAFESRRIRILVRLWDIQTMARDWIFPEKRGALRATIFEYLGPLIDEVMPNPRGE